jgi:hypothetical protein
MILRAIAEAYPNMTVDEIITAIKTQRHGDEVI